MGIVQDQFASYLEIPKLISHPLEKLWQFQFRETQIQNMLKLASESEVIFESAPQLTLQLYVVLSKLTPVGWKTWFSITTSILSLLISLVHSKYIENLPEHSWKDYVKSIFVILPNIIFRILSLR